MKKIIVIFLMFVLSNCSYYGKVNEKGEKVVSFETEQSTTTQNEIKEEINEQKENTEQVN